jgi:hypothetical protein
MRSLHTAQIVHLEEGVCPARHIVEDCEPDMPIAKAGEFIQRCPQPFRRRPTVLTRVGDEC